MCPLVDVPTWMQWLSFHRSRTSPGSNAYNSPCWIIHTTVILNQIDFLVCKNHEPRNARATISTNVRLSARKPPILDIPSDSNPNSHLTTADFPPFPNHTFPDNNPTSSTRFLNLRPSLNSSSVSHNHLKLIMPPTSSHTTAGPRSIWTRKTDILYIVFLSINIFLALGSYPHFHAPQSPQPPQPPQLPSLPLPLPSYPLIPATNISAHEFR